MRSTRLSLLIGVIFSCLFIACSKPQYATTDYGTDIPSTLLDTISIRIKPGDRLTIQSLNNLASVIFENTANNRGNATPVVPAFDVYVDNDGNIALPKVGLIKVGGLTLKEATNVVQLAYKDIINEPAFNVRVTNMRVKVIGAVNKQGLYYLEKQNQTLGEVLAMAEGVNFEQLGKRMMITRRTPQGDIAMEFKMNINQLGNPKLTNIIVRDNDIVYLQPSKATVNASRFQQISGFLSPLALLFNSAALIISLSK